MIPFWLDVPLGLETHLMCWLQLHPFLKSNLLRSCRVGITSTEPFPLPKLLWMDCWITNQHCWVVCITTTPHWSFIWNERALRTEVMCDAGALYVFKQVQITADREIHSSELITTDEEIKWWMEESNNMYSQMYFHNTPNNCFLYGGQMILHRDSFIWISKMYCSAQCLEGTLRFLFVQCDLDQRSPTPVLNRSSF